MYNDSDLTAAVKAGVLQASDVAAFRDFMQTRHHHEADEEHFRLLTSFNDIFVVLACGLVLFPLLWTLEAVSPILAYASFSAVAWLLAEFFVLKRKMALPAVALMIAFAGGIFTLADTLFNTQNEVSTGTAFLAVLIATYIHWRRFKVPITVAAMTAAALGVLGATIMQLFPEQEGLFLSIVFGSGIAVFIFAMRWDRQDTQRVSYKTDVAFWLHVLAAPLIVHPVFSSIEINNGTQGIAVIALYIILTVVSIVIDRRVFMVSALGYVIYAMSVLMTEYGTIENQLGLTAVIVGVSLLLMSAYWRRIRRWCVSLLPDGVSQWLPESR